jgi:hypothetical protein
MRSAFRLRMAASSCTRFKEELMSYDQTWNVCWHLFVPCFISWPTYGVVSFFKRVVKIVKKSAVVSGSKPLTSII